jgi:hypothetical protein
MSVTVTACGSIVFNESLSRKGFQGYGEFGIFELYRFNVIVRKGIWNISDILPNGN